MLREPRPSSPRPTATARTVATRLRFAVIARSSWRSRRQPATASWVPTGTAPAGFATHPPHRLGDPAGPRRGSPCVRCLYLTPAGGEAIVRPPGIATRAACPPIARDALEPARGRRPYGIDGRPPRRTLRAPAADGSPPGSQHRGTPRSPWLAVASGQKQMRDSVGALWLGRTAPARRPPARPPRARPPPSNRRPQEDTKRRERGQRSTTPPARLGPAGCAHEGRSAVRPPYPGRRGLPTPHSG